MVARLCNGAKFDSATVHLPLDERQIKGDATDSAILRFAEGLSVPSIGATTPALLESYEKTFEIPFNSRNKWMLSVVQLSAALNEKLDSKADGPGWMLVKGGPDVLFPKCGSVMLADGSVSPLDASLRAQLHLLQERWSSEGQRVLALCRRSLEGVPIDPAMSQNDVEQLMYKNLEDLTLVGLVGIRDPPRHDVADAIGIIRRAGVRVFMVTGDFRLTALAIARQVCVFVIVVAMWCLPSDRSVLSRGRNSMVSRMCGLPCSKNSMSASLRMKSNPKRRMGIVRWCSPVTTLSCLRPRTGMSSSAATPRSSSRARRPSRS